MKKLVIFICIFLLFRIYTIGQLPLNFSSSNWKFYANTTLPQIPPNHGAFDWKSPGYNTVLTGWPNNPPYLDPVNSTPFGYPGSSYTGTTFSNIYPTSPLYSGNKLITSYFRNTITDPNLQSYTSLSLNVKRDDGIIVYLNGIEVYRDNLPSGTITQNTPATTFVGTGSSHDLDQNIPTPITISGALLSSVLSAYPTDLTKLTITAEIHQSLNSGDIAPYSTSSDCYFDLSLSGVLGPLTPLITRGPYLQLPTPFGMQVRWSTNTSEIGKVCYSDLGPISPSNPGTCQTQTISSLTTDHIVDITGLSNGTKYYYSIQHLTSSLIEESTQHYFNTPPTSVDNAKTTRIWVTGDASEGDYIPVQAAVLTGFQNFKTSQSIPSLDLWLLLGDNAYDNGLLNEYEEGFFNIYDASSSHIMKQTPIMPCVGNHDYYNGGDITVTNPTIISNLETKNKVNATEPGSIFSTPGSLFDHRLTKNNPFFEVFSLPPNGLGGKYSTESTTSKKGYYSYTHNNIHFICLDSYGFYNEYLLYGNIPNYSSGPLVTNNTQFSWLISDLNISKTDPNIKWTIMYWHHAPYTRGGGHFSDTTFADEFILKGIRENLIKYLDNAEYKIDLVLNGHSHSYERSRLLKNHHNDEITFTSALHNNPSIIPGTNSFANSNGKFTVYPSCPYIKSSTNTINEGVVYVVTGSAGQRQPTTHLNPTDGITLKGHKALNGASFSTPTATNRGTIEDTQGGSFYLEIQSNRLDAKFINESGVVADNFTIFKDVSSPTIVNQIHQNELPGQSPDLQKLSTPAWPGVTQFTLTNPIGSTTGPHPSGLINVTTPDIGPLYTIKDQTGCLKQDYRFTFNGSCWGNVNINNTFYPNVIPEVISSSGVITSKSLIKNTANVSFIAKNANNLITIGTPPLFQAELGSIFSATINSSLSCPPGGM